MVAVARKNLFAERTRLAITVGGVALSIILIVVLWSLYQGWKTKVTAFIDSANADLWVSQEGATNMFHSISLLPEEVGAALRALPGVAEARPFLGRQVAFQVNGREVTTFLVGYDRAGGSGPVKLVEGRHVAGAGEIVLDRVFARSIGRSLGDELTILGQPLKVVGISTDGNVMVYQFSFVDLGQLREMLRSQQVNNYYLVSISENADTEQVRRSINAISGIQASTAAEFRDVNRRLVDEAFLPIIIVLVAVGIIIGIAVIGLTIYTGTIEKTREYAVLKAVGASNWRLYRIILEQAMIAGVLGYVVGVALAFGTMAVAQRTVPAFITDTRVADLALVLALALGMAAVASYVPLRRLLAIDPAIVFKG